MTNGSRTAISLALGMAGLALLAACAKPDPASAAGAPRQAAGAQGQAQGGAGQGRSGGGRRAAVVPVQAATVQTGLLTARREASGVVVAVTQSLVAAQVAGVVKSVPRSPGDWVKAGDIVVQLDDAQLRLAVDNAQVAVDNARINLRIGEENASQDNPKLALQVKSAQSALDSAQKFYDSQKALYDLGGLSASALDTAASQLSAAQANLEGAKAALDQNNKSGDQTIAQLRLALTQAQNQLAQARLGMQYASIRAPFDGQLAAINMQPGMYVGLNTPAFNLVSADRQISFGIPPSDAMTLTLHSPVNFTYHGEIFRVRVSQAPSAPINGVVPMTASVPANFRLSYGTVGSISYDISVAQGILVPLGALATLEDKNYVFSIVDGKAVRKDVTIVGEAGITAVVDGLAPGDVVILSPPPGLIQGSQVQVVNPQQGDAAAGAGGPTPGSAAAPGSSAITPAAASPGAAPSKWQGAKKAQGAKPEQGTASP